MQRYFSNSKNNDLICLSKEDSYHIVKVMRMSLGEKVEVVVDNITYICEIIDLNPVCVKIIEELKEDNEQGISVSLIQSVVKEQKMDYILQKSTELGVYSIYPYQAERSIVKIDEKWSKKKERWQSIVKEASEQSKRNRIPEIMDVLHLKDLQELEGFTYKFFCSVNEKQENLKKVLSKCKKGDTMIVIVGPEGGFTDSEEDRFLEAGFVPISLGKSVLRTETASSFLLSVIRYIDME